MVDLATVCFHLYYSFETTASSKFAAQGQTTQKGCQDQSASKGPAWMTICSFHKKSCSQGTWRIVYIASAHNHHQQEDSSKAVERKGCNQWPHAEVIFQEGLQFYQRKESSATSCWDNFKKVGQEFPLPARPSSRCVQNFATVPSSWTITTIKVCCT